MPANQGFGWRACFPWFGRYLQQEHSLEQPLFDSLPSASRKSLAWSSAVLESIWGFKWEYPQIIYFNKIFPYKPSIIRGPPFWETPISGKASQFAWNIDTTRNCRVPNTLALPQIAAVLAESPHLAVSLPSPHRRAHAFPAIRRYASSGSTSLNMFEYLFKICQKLLRTCVSV